MSPSDMAVTLRRAARLGADLCHPHICKRRLLILLLGPVEITLIWAGRAGICWRRRDGVLLAVLATERRRWWLNLGRRELVGGRLVVTRSPRRGGMVQVAGKGEGGGGGYDELAG